MIVDDKYAECVGARNAVDRAELAVEEAEKAWKQAILARDEAKLEYSRHLAELNAALTPVRWRPR